MRRTLVGVITAILLVSLNGLAQQANPPATSPQWGGSPGPQRPPIQGRTPQTQPVRPTPGRSVALNPQPLPPGVRLTIQQVRALIAKTPAWKLKTGPRVKSPALASALITTLKTQKQAAEMEARQVLSSQTRTVATPVRGTLGSSSHTEAASETASVPTIGRYGRLSANSSFCTKTAIATVNQKTTGVVFTPQPEYNHFTITGCGFGNTPGKVYLQAGPGGFPTHGGRVMLYPLDGMSWGKHWSDRFIDARVDPNLTGELDQSNITLVVEPANAQRAEAAGFSFYALRGQPILLQSVPQSSVVLYPGYNPYYLSPDASSFGTNPVTLSVFRSGFNDNDYHNPSACCRPDDIKLNLKPGFAVDSSQSVYYESNPTVTLNLELDWEAGIVGQNEIQPRWLVASASEGTDHPDLGPFFSLYGLNIWVVGPAGITDPWQH